MCDSGVAAKVMADYQQIVQSLRAPQQAVLAVRGAGPAEVRHVEGTEQRAGALGVQERGAELGLRGVTNCARGAAGVQVMPEHAHTVNRPESR